MSNSSVLDKIAQLEKDYRPTIPCKFCCGTGVGLVGIGYWAGSPSEASVHKSNDPYCFSCKGSGESNDSNFEFRTGTALGVKSETLDIVQQKVFDGELPERTLLDMKLWCLEALKIERPDLQNLEVHPNARPCSARNGGDWHAIICTWENKHYPQYLAKYFEGGMTEYSYPTVEETLPNVHFRPLRDPQKRAMAELRRWYKENKSSPKYTYARYVFMNEHNQGVAIPIDDSQDTVYRHFTQKVALIYFGSDGELYFEYYSSHQSDHFKRKARTWIQNLMKNEGWTCTYRPL